MRLPRPVANGLLVVASAAAALFGIELYFRIFDPQPMSALERSPRLGWLHTPGVEFVYTRDEFSVPVSYSSAGLRDREYSVAKPAGVVRVAVLGDSFVEALQVPADSMLTQQLVRCLGGAGRCEVMNFGVSGYGSCQQLALLEERVLRFDPDVVVSVYYHNDLDDNVRFGVCHFDSMRGLRVDEAAALPWKERAASGAKSILRQHSHLFVFLSSRRLGRHGASPTTLVLPPTQTPAAGRSAACPGEHPTLESQLTLTQWTDAAEQAFAAHVAIVTRMQERCRAAGVAFLVALAPTATHLEPERLREAMQARGCSWTGHDLELPHARMRAGLGAAGVPLVDLLPAFRLAGAAHRLFYRVDGHWNPAGHRCAARALCEALVERGILATTEPTGGS
jgi:hypothetical protein